MYKDFQRCFLDSNRSKFSEFCGQANTLKNNVFQEGFLFLTRGYHKLPVRYFLESSYHGVQLDVSNYLSEWNWRRVICRYISALLIPEGSYLCKKGTLCGRKENWLTLHERHFLFLVKKTSQMVVYIWIEIAEAWVTNTRYAHNERESFIFFEGVII